MGKWNKYVFDVHPWKISSKPGVYVIYGDDNLIYVGQSINVEKRINGHVHCARYSAFAVTPWGRFKELFVKVSYSKKYGDWAMRELRLIKRLQPKGNCIHTDNKRKVSA